MNLEALVPLIQTFLWILFVIGVAVYLRQDISELRSNLVKRVKEGASLKVGLFEIGELKERVSNVKAEQQRQGNDIKTLRFLISHLLPTYELNHLRDLEEGEPFPFTRNRNFDNELRHLRNLGFIEHRPNTPFGIASLPQSGEDLRDRMQATDRGREYLRLLREAEEGKVQSG